MQWRIINFLQMCFAFFWTSFWISAAFVAMAFTLNRSIALVMARRFWAPRMIKLSGARFCCDPLPKNVDWNKPYIFVMNHQSMLDIPCAFAMLPAELRFVAKKQLKWVPFLGWYMWATGMVFVDRGERNKAKASLDHAGEQIRRGATILAYPEGTRSRDGRVLPFKKGAFILALAAKVPVIPVAIEGSNHVSPKNKPWKLRPAGVRMKIGQPIETAHRTFEQRDELLNEVRAALVKLHHEIGGAGAIEGRIDKTEAEALVASVSHSEINLPIAELATLNQAKPSDLQKVE